MLLETYLTELNNESKKYMGLTLKDFTKSDLSLVMKAMAKKPYHPIFSNNIESRYIESDGISLDAYKVFNGSKLVSIVSFRFFSKSDYSHYNGFSFYMSNPEISFVSFDNPNMTAWSIMRALRDYTSDDSNMTFEMDIYSKDNEGIKVANNLKAKLHTTGKVKDKGIEYVDYKYFIQTPFWF